MRRCQPTAPPSDASGPTYLAVLVSFQENEPLSPPTARVVAEACWAGEGNRLRLSGDGATGNGARDSDVVGPGGEAPQQTRLPLLEHTGPAARVTVVVVVAGQRATRRHHDL